MDDQELAKATLRELMETATSDEVRLQAAQTVLLGTETPYLVEPTTPDELAALIDEAFERREKTNA